MEALLKSMEKDIHLAPLIFSVLQFLLGAIFFIIFLIIPYNEILFQRISIPKTLSLLLSIISGRWYYCSYLSVKIAYMKYRRARQNLLQAISIKTRITRLLKLLSSFDEDNEIFTKNLKDFTYKRKWKLQNQIEKIINPQT